MNMLLVIPSFRDADRLSVFLPELCHELAAVDGVEILVVDDGSGPDQSAELVRVVEEARRNSEKPAQPLLIEHAGKGGAIYAGWDSRTGSDWLGFVDADGAVSASEVARALREVEARHDEIDGLIACRVKMLGRNVDRSFHRHLVGRMYATLTYYFATHLPVYDSQCGLKFFRRSLYERLRSQLKEREFAFDLEFLSFAIADGARIVEFPVDWRDVPGSKVSVFRDGWKMLRAASRLPKFRRPPLT